MPIHRMQDRVSYHQCKETDQFLARPSKIVEFTNLMPSKALSKNMSNIDFKARVGAPAALGSIAAASIDFSSWELVS